MNTNTLADPAFADVTKSWTERHGFLWLRKKSFSVRAFYVAGTNDNGLMPTSLARVEIQVNGVLAYESDLPYFPHMEGDTGEAGLALQVLVKLQTPAFLNPAFRIMMARFVMECRKTIADPAFPLWHGLTYSPEDHEGRTLNGRC